jgi:3-oxoisoapionate kinase
MKDRKPFRPLYAYYGDDFTGSTDVLEALALNGISAVLFTHPPDEKQLRAFSGCRAIGLAGESRSRTPEWMTRNLPQIFTAMRAWGAPVNHYKVCSTFDSSPQLGNIGRAMELGAAAFAAEFVPIVVGAPRLGRWVVFANLFAAAQGAAYRIDRHPAMSLHPVTPMREADLRKHLAAQTQLPMGLVDLSAFQAGLADARFREELSAGAKGIVFDGIDDSMLEQTARILCERAGKHPVCAVGSSGLTYGLVEHWRRLRWIGDAPPPEKPRAADRLLVLSGSCSPATAAQIRRARQQGFDTRRLEGEEPWGVPTRKALEALSHGQSVVLYTALGPKGRNGGGAYGEEFGAALGSRLREMLTVSGVRRILIAGGDTATQAVKQLALDALTFTAPLAPGAPLCRAHAPGSPFDGLELVLKGGQIGPEEFFAQVRDGG